MLVSAALRYFISIIEPPRVVTRDTTGEGSISCSRPSSHKSQPVDNLNHCPACDLAGQGSLLGRPAVRPAGDPSGHCTPCVWSNRDGRGHLGRGEVGSGRVRSGRYLESGSFGRREVADAGLARRTADPPSRGWNTRYRDTGHSGAAHTREEAPAPLRSGYRDRLLRAGHRTHKTQLVLNHLLQCNVTQLSCSTLSTN